MASIDDEGDGGAEALGSLEATASDIVDGAKHVNEDYDKLEFKQDGVEADAQLTSDGRFNITVEGNQDSLNRLFQPVLQELPLPDTHAYLHPKTAAKPEPKLAPAYTFPTKLNIVIHVVGSRGDVQPFIALGRVLRSHGHRVRLATHPVFEAFVEENGLEFFSIGGDPAELMAFMVKNPGLLPGIESLRAGDVGKRRKEMAEIIDGCWRSCIDLLVDADGQVAEKKGERRPRFIADAIIANPPSFAHIHCAEKLKIPLHIMFTMPWSPTTAFPHPLANTKISNVDPEMVNYLSYALVETMTWQGLGDLVNSFRVKKLGLSEIDPTFAPGMLTSMRIPHTYAWSPALIPQPHDWDNHITIPGFFFLPLASFYKPPEDLEAFLEAGPAPVYIGFGSIVVHDPDVLTRTIFDAVKKAGVRALVSKGWGGLGHKDTQIPENIYMLDNCPHDWLFPRVSCVVHHGGAGTMAAGIAAGRPTVIVPFFGDQSFWGDMVAKAGAGPAPIPHKKLTADRLAAAITEALQPETAQKASALANSINHEEGPEAAALSFYTRLPINKMHCLLSPSRIAVWRVKRTKIRLSAMAAALLCQAELLDWKDLRFYGPCDHRTDVGPMGPMAATVKVSYRLISDLLFGFSEVSRGVYKRYHTNPRTHSRSPSRKSTPGHSRNSSVHSIAGHSSTASSSYGDNDIDSEADNDHDASTEHNHGPHLHLHPDDAAAHAKLTKKGLWRIAAAPVKGTADFTSSMAQGLHNLPKLYGDTTVRPPEKITGWQSGLKAAGKELGHGIYDGVTGLYTQPVSGYRHDGAGGILPGLGRGLAGVLIKPLAGGAGLLGFTFEGLWREVRRHYGRGVDGYLRAVRMEQGMRELEEATEEEERVVVERWMEVVGKVEREREENRKVRGGKLVKRRRGQGGCAETRILKEVIRPQ